MQEGNGADVVEGVIAAMGAPVVMSLGLLLWEKYWIGSAVMLNAVKCTIATVFFLAAVPFRIQAWRDGLQLTPKDLAPLTSNATASMQNSDRPDVPRVEMLVLSAFLGIALGDIVWLLALQALGARKLILVDSVKPFCGALFAWLFLGEQMRPQSAIGILVTVAGVLTVALQRREPDPLEYGDVELQQQGAAVARGDVCPRCRTAHDIEGDINDFCAGCGRRKGAVEFTKSTSLPHPPRVHRLIRQVSSLIPTSSTSVIAFLCLSSLLQAPRVKRRVALLWKAMKPNSRGELEQKTSAAMAMLS